MSQKQIYLTHAMVALLTFVSGVVIGWFPVEGQSRSTQVQTAATVLPQLVEHKALERLLNSPRWKIDPKLLEGVEQSISLKGLRLVGVVIKDEPYALLEVEGTVRKIRLNEGIGQNSETDAGTDAFVSAIRDDRIVITHADEQIELLLYPEEGGA